MMFNPKGDGFPAAYDTPERQEEYKQFYLQCFNNFFKKNYQDETKCRQFLRKEMQALQKDYSLYPSCRNNRIRKPEGKQYITEVYPQIP